MLLCDIKVLHKQFKEKNPEMLTGLSKFAELRPKWCVLAGSRGTHSVCVCVIHENFKLMFEAVDFKNLTKDLPDPVEDYSDCLKFITCENATPLCYFNECENCPKIEHFSDYVMKILTENNLTQVMYSIWQSTDRCNLKKECLSAEDYVDELCAQLKKLLTHHFVAKTQSEYLSNRKNNLNENEVLVQCDYSKNYPYVVQNAKCKFKHFITTMINAQCTLLSPTTDQIMKLSIAVLYFYLTRRHTIQVRCTLCKKWLCQKLRNSVQKSKELFMLLMVLNNTTKINFK